MKKIVFVINNFEIGGVQKSLLNLLTEIHDKYDITVITFFSNKEYERKIPEDVKIIKTRSAFRQLGMSAKNTKSNFFLYIERVLLFILTKVFGRSFVIKLISFGKRKYKGYDIAISYIHESSQKSLYGGCNEFVIRLIDADKKIGWLHCDFERSGAFNKQSRKIYGKLDTVIACSDGCRRSFIKCFPEFSDKTFVVPNCHNYEQIKNLSENAVLYDKSYINIITVARLSKEKGIDRVINSIKVLIDKGYKVRYHIVGSGDQEVYLKNTATELSISDHVFFYGNQTNPYVYMVNADLFVLASYHEAAPMVFDEAAFLGLPVLATETTSTKEMIEETGSGWVCENDQEKITEAMISILSDKIFLSDVRKHLTERTFDNNKSVEKFRELIS